MQDLLTRVSPPPQATSILPSLITEREWRCLPWDWIKGWKGWRKGMIRMMNTWERKRWDGAVGVSWERFNAWFSSNSSADNETCNVSYMKTVWNTNNNMVYFHWTDKISVRVISHWFDPDYNHQLGNCLLGSWWFGEGNEGGTSGWEGEKPPKPSSLNWITSSQSIRNIKTNLSNECVQWVWCHCQALIWRPYQLHNGKDPTEAWCIYLTLKGAYR